MVLLPTPYQPTVEKIYKSYEDKNTDPFRQHLGASLIGTECQRKLWYGFRFCSSPNFSGRLLRLFQTGFKEEARIIDERDRQMRPGENQAVLAAGDVGPGENDDVENLAEDQRGDGKIDIAQAGREIGHEQSSAGGAGQPKQDGEPEIGRTDQE